MGRVVVWKVVVSTDVVDVAAAVVVEVAVVVDVVVWVCVGVGEELRWRSLRV